MNKQKLIGVCITKINKRMRTDFIGCLHNEAVKQGYKLVVYNSVTSFSDKHSCSHGAKGIYDTIDFRTLSALVIVTDTFSDNMIYREIIERAKVYGLPIIAVKSEEPDCYSIIGDYSKAYKLLISHIICEHEVTDTFFIGGYPDNDPETQKRLSCYKEVLTENGIPFSEENIGYGEHWNVAAGKVTEELIESRGYAPKAIFCANDSMAIGVCDALREYGYRVPEDVFVTGFDGIPDGEFLEPTLTTCKEDNVKLSKLVFDTIGKAINEKLPCGVFYNDYDMYTGGSCGCREQTKTKGASRLLKTIQEMEAHEVAVYSWTDRLVSCKDMLKAINIIAEGLLRNSFICLTSDYFSLAMGTDAASSGTGSREYIVIRPEDKNTSDLFQLQYIDENELNDILHTKKVKSTADVLSGLYLDNMFCGFYAVSTDNIYAAAHMLTRLTKALNTVFHVWYNRQKEEQLTETVQKSALVNYITQLPNLRGATKWFDEFSALPQNHLKTIVVSVYNMPKYKFIYESYGIEEIEDAIRVTVNALKKANPVNCFIAHVSVDEFIIINYMDSPDEVSDVINSATGIFFSEIEKFNSDSTKEYYLEINCGCTVANAGWSGSLEGFIKIANNEMYLNRLNTKEGDVVKENISYKQFHSALDLLIERNLFNYHFQPIVNVRNGEIYGYEALMRTDPSIGMTPLQVLDTAKAYKKLYDIERATIFNTMERYTSNIESFGGKKLFINSIPGYSLRATDNKMISEMYGEYMSNFVFEITELDSISDIELDAMKNLGAPSSENLIAVDDYGTGHSNIVNLLRYSPHIIKLDRYLVTDIHKDTNKQMFVKSTIEFARMNNIKVLAEGVETAEELHAVIAFGVDYVQGYYTGRPAPHPTAEIDEIVRSEIIAASVAYC